MPFETPIPIPATLLVAGLAWAGSMYLLAPTLGKRLLDKSGAIVRCEANFQAAAGAARAKAETALGPPPAQPAAPRAGDLVTGLVTFGRTDRAADAYRQRYADDFDRQLNPYLDALMLPARQELEEKKRLFEIRTKQIADAFRLDIARAGSICACRGHQAVNEQQATVAWSLGTLSVLPAPDWSVAIAASSVIARCTAGGS